MARMKIVQGGATRNSRDENTSNITGTDNKTYNVISVLYHSLQAADLSATYEQDAEKEDDFRVVEFFQQCQQQFRQIAEQAKTILRHEWQTDSKESASEWSSESSDDREMDIQANQERSVRSKSRFSHPKKRSVASYNKKAPR